MAQGELINLDNIVFDLHDDDCSPGLLLKKDGLVTWTLSPTRSIDLGTIMELHSQVVSMVSLCLLVACSQ